MNPEKMNFEVSEIRIRNPNPMIMKKLQAIHKSEYPYMRTYKQLFERIIEDWEVK